MKAFWLILTKNNPINCKNGSIFFQVQNNSHRPRFLWPPRNIANQRRWIIIHDGRFSSSLTTALVGRKKTRGPPGSVAKMSAIYQGATKKKAEKYCAKLAEKSRRAFFSGVPLCWRELNLSNARYWLFGASIFFVVSALASTIRTGGCSPGFCCVFECLIGGQFTIITYMVGINGQLTRKGFLC